MARQQRESADELFAGVTEESVARLVAELRRRRREGLGSSAQRYLVEVGER
jgi:hypothetical protein